MNNSTNSDLMNLVAGYKNYATADELDFTAQSEAPAATPGFALWSIATSKLFVGSAASGASAGVSYRVAC